MDDALIGDEQIAGQPTGGIAPPRRLGVCHIASGDRWAGAEAQVAALLRVLSRDPSLEVSAIVLNNGRLVEELRACGIVVDVIPESQYGFWSTLAKAAEFARQRRVDVLHSHRYKENLLAALLARRCSVPVVVRTQHGMPEPFKGMAHIKQRILQQLDWAAARYRADAVISVTSEMKAELDKKSGGKAVVIHNGVDLARFAGRVQHPQAKAALGIDPERLVIAAGGRLDPIKRFDLFLRTIAEVSSAIPTVQAIVMGDGGEAANLRALADSLGVSDRILFLGHRDDIADVLSAADVFLITSDHEGLPMILLECMALGVPVLSRNVGGIGEVIRNGVDGVLIDSAEPDVLAADCVRVAHDPELMQRLSSNAVVTVRERFSAEQTASNTVALYRTLYERRRVVA